MFTRPKKRQKTDPSPVKPDTKTLFHFFSKPNSNASAVTEASPPKTESESSSINEEPRRKSDIGVFSKSFVVKTEMTLPRVPTGDSLTRIESEWTQFEPNFTEQNDSCSPTKEEADDIDSFDGLDEEYGDEYFRDDELDFRYEGVDDIEDDFGDVKPTIKQEPLDLTIDDGPSCPFCNFSFKGLSENVPPSLFIILTQVNHITRKSLSR